MGFERITSVLQNKQSNYDTDIFTPIMDEIQRVTGFEREYQGKVGKDDKDDGNIDMAYRVVADHIRTLTFAITDGAQPDSTGRDYVVRRVLRRGIRYGSQILGGKIGFFSNLVDCVVKEMGDAFPEIADKDNVERVKQIILDEESLFDKTVRNGEIRFKKIAQQCIQENRKEISGKDAFLLQSSFGFPIDLTILMAEEQGLSVNLLDFDKELEFEKNKSRMGATNENDKCRALDANDLDYLRKQKINETDSSFKYVWQDIDATVVGIYKIDDDGKEGNFVSSAKQDEFVGVILDRTSFYHESGGQVSDEGRIDDIKSDGKIMSFKVDSVQIQGPYDVHYGSVSFGELKIGSKYKLKVNYNYRSKVAPNHTMTHVLNYGLRKILGKNCDQKGSIVDSEKARFDFSHMNKMTLDEIISTEKIVQDIINKNLKVYTKVLNKEKAFKISSIRAMFGEKYPSNVRVVSIGVSSDTALKDPANDKWYDYSIELCGGTHLKTTGEAGDFLIISEEPLSAGVRRIVAFTGEGAKKARNEAKILENRLKSAMNKKGYQLTEECRRLNGDLREAKISAIVKNDLTKLLDDLNEKDKKNKKELSNKQKQRGKESAKEWINEVSEEKCDYLIKRIDVGLNNNALKEAIKVFHKKCNNIPIMLFSGAPNEIKNKILVKAEIPKKFNNKNKLSAKEWINKIIPLVEGGGGGNDKAAEAKGSSMEKINQAMNVAKEYVQQYV